MLPWHAYTLTSPADVPAALDMLRGRADFIALRATDGKPSLVVSTEALPADPRWHLEEQRLTEDIVDAVEHFLVYSAGRRGRWSWTPLVLHACIKVSIDYRGLPPAKRRPLNFCEAGVIPGHPWPLGGHRS